MTIVWNKWRSCGSPGAFDFDHRKCGVGLSQFGSGRSVCSIQVKSKTKSAYKSECIDHVFLEAAARTCHLFVFYHTITFSSFQSRRSPFTFKSQGCYRWCPESDPSGYFHCLSSHILVLKAMFSSLWLRLPVILSSDCPVCLEYQDDVASYTRTEVDPHDETLKDKRWWAAGWKQAASSPLNASSYIIHLRYSCWQNNSRIWYYCFFKYIFQKDTCSFREKNPTFFCCCHFIDWSSRFEVEFIQAVMCVALQINIWSCYQLK